MLRSSFEEHRSEGDAVDRVATFEETYPRYEFAVLVRLAMAAGAWLGGMRRRVERRRPDTSGGPSPHEMKPAE
jgi:hypothetical protein